MGDYESQLQYQDPHAVLSRSGVYLSGSPPPTSHTQFSTPFYGDFGSWGGHTGYGSTSGLARSAYPQHMLTHPSITGRFSPTSMLHHPYAHHMMQSGPSAHSGLQMSSKEDMLGMGSMQSQQRVSSLGHNSNLGGGYESKVQMKKPPHIKKPLNAFMLFMKEMRAKVVAECTLKESAAINQILGRKWHALSREEQAKYYEMARKEKELHMQMFPGWSARDNYAIQLAKNKKTKKRRVNDDGDRSCIPESKKMNNSMGYPIVSNSWCKSEMKQETMDHQQVYDLNQHLAMSQMAASSNLANQHRRQMMSNAMYEYSPQTHLMGGNQSEQTTTTTNNTGEHITFTELA